MIAALLNLSLRGSLVLLLVWVLDQLLASRMTACWRRLWWLVLPFAFLLPVRFALPSSSVTVPLPSTLRQQLAPDPTPLIASGHAPAAPSQVFADNAWLELLWLTGVAASSLGIIIPTWKAHRQWNCLRLSTDPVLLDLLEDCKAIARTSIPIGLIVSDQVAAPALLGWLRPRILLPSGLVASSTIADLRAVFLHELAHLRSGDIPLNWLFAWLRVIHWFNPFAWLAGAAWARFREEAADERAIRWLGPQVGLSYGEILLRTLGNCQGGAAPSGALAIGESVQHLKRRIIMIRNHASKTNRGLLASAVILILVALMSVAPTLAQDDAMTASQKECDLATKGMQTWLAEIDNAQYAKSWTDSAKSFQTALTSDKWGAALTSVRTPLGKLLDRKLASSMYETGIQSGGTILPGQYVIAQFETSFENLKYARETVTFQKDADGTWRAAGYYIKPR